MVTTTWHEILLLFAALAQAPRTSGRAETMGRQQRRSGAVMVVGVVASMADIVAEIYTKELSGSFVEHLMSKEIKEKNTSKLGSLEVGERVDEEKDKAWGGVE